MAIAAARYVGASVLRSEDPRILTGAGRYVDDLTMPGMLHAAFVRSYVAHGRVTNVDAEAARAIPGVVAVYTGEELQALVTEGAPPVGGMFGGRGGPKFTILATDKVRLVGDPVALVVASSRCEAEDGCEAIEVGYEELEPIITVEQALDPTRPKIFDDLESNVMAPPNTTSYGDVDAVFARADRVIRVDLRQDRHQNVPMETRGCVASYDRDTGELDFHSSTQGVHMNSGVLARQLGLAADKVRARAGDVGGSFGLKIGISREEVACALASQNLGHPVKWIEDRAENLIFSGQAREESFEVEAAITDEGDILGLRVKMTLNAGAYPGLGRGLPGMVQGMIPGPYKLQALEFTSTVVASNKATYVAYRGPWASETFVRERVIDIVAKELNKDPLEIRLRNVVTRDEEPLAMVTGRSLRGVTARESIERMAELVDLPAFRAEQLTAREEGRYLGIGMATYIEAAPGPRGERPLGMEVMRLRLEPDGTVKVFTGQMPHGQGHETTIAQVAADQMGVPFEHVQVVVGDTAVVPPGFTGGSRAATMAGGASLHGARALKDRVLDVASHLLEASVGDLDIIDGVVAVAGVPARGRSLAEVAEWAVSGSAPEDVDLSLEVTHTYDGGQGGWSGGTHCAVVEVDVDTGQVQVVRYLVVEDCGELINPAIVEGQIRGGVAQGIGAVLLERSAYDPDSGQFLAGSFADYLLPTASDVPRIEIEHLQTVPLDDDVNFRGVGEGGMIVCPPTVCNAIEDALAPFSVRIEDQHLPPERVLGLIDASNRR